MIIIEGTFRVADLARARSDMETMVHASRAEDGCIAYSYAIDLIDPTLVRVSERWASREAFNAHVQSQHIKTWRAAWREIGASDRELRLYDAEPQAL